MNCPTCEIAKERLGPAGFKVLDGHRRYRLALERALEALHIIMDSSEQSDFIQSLSAKDIAFEAVEQIQNILGEK